MVALFTVDDKVFPLYRLLWVSTTPHFCGEEDCQREGEYEIRLDNGESLWCSRKQRDEAVTAMEAWQGDGDDEEDPWPEDAPPPE